MRGTHGRNTVILAAVVLAAGLLAGCPQPATVVTVTTDATAFVVGDTVTFTATSTHAEDTSFTWAVDDDQVLEITAKQTGATVTVDCIGAGPAVITATGGTSGVSGTYNVTVTEPVLNTSHAGRYTTYEGAKTCIPCHSGKAEEVHASIHYQWDSQTGGKMVGINGFCTYPAINFIGILTNADGEKVSGGCAQCHVGMGAKPSLEVTTAQLENIDCLVCHGPAYKRKVAKLEDDSLAFVPDEAAMAVPLVEAITDVAKSSSATCLNCHAKAGGGPNNKRGDIEPEHYNATPDFDVHMAVAANGGVGLECISCHTTEAHRIAGQGADLRSNDSDVNLRCTSCHDAAPHSTEQLNAHTARLDCTVCHIPTFANGASGTDMYRDFTAIEYHASKKLYEPVITRASNVEPEYRFWDGTSYISFFGDAVVTDATSGNVIMAAPNGAVNTAGAKIFPFKVHQAMQPKRTDDNSLIGLKMGVLFQRGAFDPNAATPTIVPWLEGATDAQVIEATIRAGASAAGNPLPAGDGAYENVQTERWMGIFHEVQPAENALRCFDCHFGGDRIDFEKLGYGVKDNPNLCGMCHDDYSDVWPAEDLFVEVHEEHVKEKGMNCSVCHNFSAAQ